MASIVLSTLNSRYSHAALGLRYLRANLGALRDDSVIREFVVRTPAPAIVDALLAERPRIVGFGVYIWNVLQTAEVIRQLKAREPGIVVVIGGPEVSHEVEAQEICRLADHVVTGWGDVTFARLAAALLNGPRPLSRVHAGEQPPLEHLALPYGEYTDADLANRTVYVEASRGCPFKCEFCLSALDRTAWPFPLEPLLAELSHLHERGARHFKFVDRTFNLKVATSVRILEFFLGLIAARPDDPPVPALRADSGSPARGAEGADHALSARHAAVRDRHPDLRRRDAATDFPAPGQRRRRSQHPLAAREHEGAPARRPDRRPAGRGPGVVRRRLRSAGRAEAARDPGGTAEAAARRADRAAHRGVRHGLRPGAAVPGDADRRARRGDGAASRPLRAVLGPRRQLGALREHAAAGAGRCAVQPLHGVRRLAARRVRTDARHPGRAAVRTDAPLAGREGNSIRATRRRCWPTITVVRVLAAGWHSARCVSSRLRSRRRRLASRQSRHLAP